VIDKIPQRYQAKFDLTTLAEHPDNPNEGDDTALSEAMDSVGFYGAIVVQQSTNRILAGHTRRRVLLDSGETRGPVILLDVDDDAALRILLGDNRLAQLAIWNDAKLLATLDKLGGATNPAALLGTGFTVDMMAALNADLTVAEPTKQHPTERGYIADRYAATDFRQVTLVMQRAEYEQLVVRLEELRAAWAAKDYAAVVVRLVDEAHAMLGADA
jgi:hypothetical protein